MFRPGSRFLVARQLDDVGWDWEYVLCDFGTWKTETVGRGITCVGVSYQERMNTTTIRDRTSYYQQFDEDALIRALMQGRGCLDESGAS